ncbi:HNH endonuclease family protein [Rhizohabitans arisaemae]|uniref:HNH endonuclease family protein n=1 Tax=Rhizohabitans arisaemae TaxID=2720610 RepID=UPI0024B11B31|nr:HNH endonuclease family protein [Rhizohabitans arisaemae]
MYGLRARVAGMVVGGVVTATALTGCTAVIGAEPSPDEPGTGRVVAGTAVKALQGLDVKGRAPMTGYDRDEFGPAWADVDRNGCDTRNDILKRDLEGERFRAGTRDCVVISGTFRDPYSDRVIDFVRGQHTSTAVQIDHVVALADAWQKGAQRWSADRRKEFANDPLNLLAVDGALNNRKQASDAASWLPPRKGYRCPYVARQIAVKEKYDLWVTSAEREAMAAILRDCPKERLPVSEQGE